MAPNRKCRVHQLINSSYFERSWKKWDGDTFYAEMYESSDKTNKRFFQGQKDLKCIQTTCEHGCFSDNQRKAATKLIADIQAVRSKSLLRCIFMVQSLLKYTPLSVCRSVESVNLCGAISSNVHRSIEPTELHLHCRSILQLICVQTRQSSQKRILQELPRGNVTKIFNNFEYVQEYNNNNNFFTSLSPEHRKRPVDPQPEERPLKRKRSSSADWKDYERPSKKSQSDQVREGTYEQHS